MKFRHQKKQVKNYFVSASNQVNSSGQVNGFVRRLSKKGRAFIIKLYWKHSSKLENPFDISQHLENVTQQSIAVDIFHQAYEKKQKSKKIIFLFY
ncbi:MAG: hypothetical protein WC915_03790 [archaeon]|jgi:CRISPR/Cas system type I-B associated protein Csh2 (Cas7 group RAMP superfamily)